MTETISVSILFFGPAREAAGRDRAEVPIRLGEAVGDLRSVLAERFPRMAPALGTVRFAVNRSFRPDEYALEDRDEVAVIPPVSGG